MRGQLSDFNGEICRDQRGPEQAQVLVNIFGRETPVELSFVQVKKI